MKVYRLAIMFGLFVGSAYGMWRQRRPSYSTSEITITNKTNRKTNSLDAIRFSASYDRTGYEYEHDRISVLDGLEPNASAILPGTITLYKKDTGWEGGRLVLRRNASQQRTINTREAIDTFLYSLCSDSGGGCNGKLKKIDDNHYEIYRW